MARTQMPGDNKQKNTLNPGDRHYNQQFNELAQKETDGTFNDIANNFDETADPSQENANIDRLREREEGSPINTAEDWADKYTGQAKQKVTLKGALANKRRNFLVSIIIVLLGGGGILTTLFSPGIGIVQLKEVLTNDLNDQLAAMDIRSEHVFRAKLKGMTSGVCNNVVSIKCKFSTMNERQLKKFRSAGFVIPDDGVEKTKLGRYRIIKMTTPDGIEIKNPNDLIKARNSSPAVRSAMKRVFNPVYYGLSDKVANTFFQKNKVSKQKVIKSVSEEENRKTLKAATAGDKVTTSTKPLIGSDGKEYIYDEQGKVIKEGEPGFEEAKKAASEKIAGLESKPKVGGKAVTGIIGSGVKGVSVLGALDSACTVYNTARAVSAMAKVARSMQLIQFAMAINTTADSIKAGDATPEEVNFVGTMLTQTDTRKEVINEQSEGEGEDAKPMPNPFYGKSGFDSPGIKTASYNDAPTLTSRSQQYMVGGGLTGSLSSVLSSIENFLGANNPAALRQSCGAIQSPWTRAAGFVAGIFMAIGTMGWSTAISIAGSVAISFALPFLEAMLADMAAGQVIGEDIAGVDAGDAWFAGSAALLGGVAQNRGMTPMSLSGMKDYIAATTETKNNMIALERYEASKTPFDVNNQYSFLGSFVRSIYPSYNQAKTDAGGVISGVASIITQGFASIVKPASAAQTFNEERFKKCKDPGYTELGIDADIFCNVRYGLTPTELAMDTDQVVDFMINSGHVDDAGEPKSDEYKKFVELCVNREDGWGDTSTENGSIGLECLDGKAETFEDISYFRVYTMDKSISDAMDDEPQQGSSTGESTTGKPDGAIDSDRGWTLADGVDYSKYECDPRTEDMGVYKSPVNGITVRLCKITFNTPDWIGDNGGNQVASVVSTNVMNMFEAARAAGVELGISDAMRLTFSGGYKSMHTYGVALDIGTPRGGQTICYGGDSRTGYGSAEAAEAACRARGGLHYKAYQWLQANAAQYGFYNYLVEPWHWSSSGR